MKKKFRIYEELSEGGYLRYFVKQNWLGLFWITPDSQFNSLVSGYYKPTIKVFHTLEDVHKALEEVRVIMEKRKKSYVKVVDYVTIEV